MSLDDPSTRTADVVPARPGPAGVVEPLLARAIGRGNRVALMARCAICALLLARIGVQHGSALLAGDAKYVFVCAVLGGWPVLSLLLHRLGRRRLTVPRWAMVSVVEDAVFVTVLLIPIMLWPHADYLGILREGDVGFYCLAVVATGLRLSRQAVIVGASASFAGLILLLVLDRGLARQPLGYGTGDVAVVAIMLVGAGLLAYLLAAGTRRLVYEGSRATLLAERARQRLGVYVSEELAARALAAGTLELGGVRRDVAVLFSDLREFTRHSEELPPERLVEELNAYLEAMVDAIRAEGGIVDKYIGDSIMAVFGLWEEGAAAARALRAAARMQAALEVHNRERRGAGKLPLRHGIGIHYGPVVAGNIGTPERMQYTVVGDVVNIASRLESATKELGRPVVASAAAVQAAAASDPDTPPTEPLGRIEVRGRHEAIEVFGVR